MKQNQVYCTFNLRYLYFVPKELVYFEPERLVSYSVNFSCILKRPMPYTTTLWTNLDNSRLRKII